MPEFRVVLPQLRRRRGAGKRSGLRGLVRSGDQGFSLIEVLVAIGVFAIIASFMAQTMASGLRGVLLGKRREVATLEANRVLEVVRSLDFDEIGLLQADPTIPSDSFIESQGGQLSYLVNSTWEPLLFAASPPSEFNPHIQELSRGSTGLTRYVYATDAGAGLKRVLVRVAWNADGTAGPENEVRVQTLVNENGVVEGGGGVPLTGDAFSTGGSLRVTSNLLGLGPNQALNINLPTSTGNSSFRAIQSSTCTTKSAGLKATNLVDLPGYSVTTTADDDADTDIPSDPPQQTASGVLNIPLGPVGNLIGPVINSPVSCDATATPFAEEIGSASTAGVLNAQTNVLGLGGLLNWLLTVARIQTQPISQQVEHEMISGQREVHSTAQGAMGQVNVLQIPGVIPDGVLRLDAISYGASVRGTDGTPSGAPTITAPAFTLRVFDNGNNLNSLCTSRSGPYCLIQVDTLAGGFNGLNIDVSHNFTQLLGLNIVNLSYSAHIHVLPPAMTPQAGEVGPNGELLWSAEYTPIKATVSLNASVLGIPLIDSTVDLNLGTARAEACAGTTCD